MLCKNAGSTALALHEDVPAKDGGEEVLVSVTSEEETTDEGSCGKAAEDKLLLVFRVFGMTPEDSETG